jgi:hypothetical protein
MTAEMQSTKKSKAWKYVAIAATVISLLLIGLIVGLSGSLWQNKAKENVEDSSNQNDNVSPDHDSTFTPGPFTQPSVMDASIRRSSQAPSYTPSFRPSRAPSTSPSSFPTMSPKICGIKFEDLLQVQSNVTAALDQLKTGFDDYVEEFSDLPGHNLRGLAAKAKLKPFQMFIKNILDWTDWLGNPLGWISLSTDVLTSIKSIQGEGVDPWNKTEETLIRIEANQEKIISMLEVFQDQQNEGFKGLSQVLKLASTKEKLEGLINEDLLVLKSAYLAYADDATKNADNVAKENSSYGKSLHHACITGQTQPYIIFQALYYQACNDCSLFDGSKSYIFSLDSFIDEANRQYVKRDETAKRIVWLRKNFSTLILTSMTEAMMLHTQCLYNADGVCKNLGDRVFNARLERMKNGLVEVANNLQDSETQLLPPPTESPTVSPTLRPTPRPTPRPTSCMISRCWP